MLCVNAHMMGEFSTRERGFGDNFKEGSCIGFSFSFFSSQKKHML